MVILLSGCTRRAPYIVFLEAPLWIALGGNSLPERLAPVGRHLGRRIEVKRALSTDTPLHELEELLNENSYHGVVVGPLLSLEVGRIATIFTEVEFVTLRLSNLSDRQVETDGSGTPLSVGRPPNVFELGFSRAVGFRRAGELLSLIEPDGMLGIISVHGHNERTIVAFREGYEDGGGQAFFDHRRLVSTRDRGEIRSLLQDLRRTGITTVLLEAGPLTPAGLEVMRGEGMRAIVSNWGYTGVDGGRPLSEVVLCSIDDDLSTGLIAIFGALDRGGAPEVVIGPTVLHWGEAALLPDSAATYIDRTAGP